MRHLHVVVHFSFGEWYPGPLSMVYKGMVQFESRDRGDPADFSWFCVLYQDLRFSFAENQVFLRRDDLLEIGSVIDV